jgi:rubrerythrin
VSDDVANISFAIGIELAARDLYQAAIDAGASGTAWPIFVGQHSSYGQRLAGLIGASANTVDTALFEERKAAFTGDRPANAAFDLENTLIATHASLLGLITDNRVADAMASIASMESHHAAYFAERSGRGENFDALFINNAAPLTPAADS